MNTRISRIFMIMGLMIWMAMGCSMGSADSAGNSQSSSGSDTTSSGSDSTDTDSSSSVPDITFSGSGNETTDRFVVYGSQTIEIKITKLSGNSLLGYIVDTDVGQPYVAFQFNTGQTEVQDSLWVWESVWEFQIQADGNWKIEVWGNVQIGDAIDQEELVDDTVVDATRIPVDLADPIIGSLS